MHPLHRTWAAVMAVALAATAAGCFDPLNQRPQAPYELIQDDPYPKLLVEVDYAQGSAPDSDALNLLKQRMEARLSKPGGITFVTESFQPSRDRYSNEDIRDTQSRVQTHFKGGDTMVLHILYLNGAHDRDTAQEKVLGVHYGPASVAIMKDTIRNNGGIFGLSSGSIERAVLVHEFGHAIGLVNNGIPMVTPHEDADHRGHSSNENSVMYWAVETTASLDIFGSTIPTQFDANDIQDIRNAGGK